MRRFTLTTLAVLGIAGGFVFSARSVSAHFVQPYSFGTTALGWVHEPAYVGVPNAVQVVIRDQAGNLYTDASSVKLQVVVECCGAHPAQSSTSDVALSSGRPLPLEPALDPDSHLGNQGEYDADFIPTSAGDYTFVLTGSIGGVTINQTVLAGDSTFAEVDAVQSAEFPSQIPSTADLSTKLDQVDQRNHDSATTALMVGIVAIVISVVLSASTAVLVIRRRKT